MPQKININQKFSLFSEHFRPKIIAELNGQHFKLAKIKGEFPWHSHKDADEMFFIWRGKITLEFRTHSIELSEGEAIVVPKGVEHRPIAHGEAEIFLIEPAGVKNTGNETTDEKFSAPEDVWI
jgi:mannose-6-phosphate isomerase-like protein (cupin superfamily)